MSHKWWGMRFNKRVQDYPQITPIPQSQRAITMRTYRRARGRGEELERSSERHDYRLAKRLRELEGKKMPRHYIAAFKVSIVDGSRSAQDAAKNIAPATVAAVAIALVSISRVLLIALVIALHKALTKNLR